MKLYSGTQRTPHKIESGPLINGTAVQTCSHYKYLGCTIQEDLKWNLHTEGQLTKCNKRKFLLRTLNNLKVNGNILAMYYNAMIISVLTYVIDSWYSGCGTDLTRKIMRFEKICARLIKKNHHKSLLQVESVYINISQEIA